MGISANLMRLGGLVLLGFLLVGCRAMSTADSADDAEKWQGTWKLVGSSYDGQPQMADMEWIVNGDKYNIRLNGRLQEDPNMFKLETSRKQIDVFHHETPPGTYGGKLKGIYQISGDSLTVCYDLTALGYPKSFETKRGSRQVLYQFRRE
jgi:uncharacterized protein (TIGR03067 family)